MVVAVFVVLSTHYLDTVLAAAVLPSRSLDLESAVAIAELAAAAVVPVAA